MSEVIFMTGFPGFLATRLWRALKEKDDQTSLAMLVHQSQLQQAKDLVGDDQQVEVFIGDITKENIGLTPEQIKWLIENTTYTYHLAAVYDLSVSKELAYDVNVTGTEHVNKLVQSFQKLKRYIYFSTAYVSGNRVGTIREDELDHGQSFKNHYEETKFLAEKAVQGLTGVPTTIIRPGVVVGDSKTGETAKFDGPYFIFRFLDHFRFFPIPYLGNESPKFNMVPVDYIIEATLYLAEHGEKEMAIYHLTDPNPYPAQDLYKWLCEALLHKSPSWRVPIKWMYWALSLKPTLK